MLNPPQAEIYKNLNNGWGKENSRFQNDPAEFCKQEKMRKNISKTNPNTNDMVKTNSQRTYEKTECAIYRRTLLAGNLNDFKVVMCASFKFKRFKLKATTKITYLLDCVLVFRLALRVAIS